MPYGTAVAKLRKALAGAAAGVSDHELAKQDFIDWTRTSKYKQGDEGKNLARDSKSDRGTYKKHDSQHDRQCDQCDEHPDLSRHNPSLPHDRRNQTRNAGVLMTQSVLLRPTSRLLATMFLICGYDPSAKSAILPFVASAVVRMKIHLRFSAVGRAAKTNEER